MVEHIFGPEIKDEIPGMVVLRALCGERLVYPQDTPPSTDTPPDAATVCRECIEAQGNPTGNP